MLVGMGMVWVWVREVLDWLNGWRWEGREVMEQEQERELKQELKLAVCLV